MHCIAIAIVAMKLVVVTKHGYLGTVGLQIVLRGV